MYENTNTKSPPQLNRPDLVLPEFSYKIMGILFEVNRQLGGGYQEKYYQRCVAKELINAHYKFQEQVPIPLQYKGEKIGIYYLDFFIEDNEENKMVLEIKKDQYFSKKHIDQVNGYLQATGLQLGILANFTSNGVKYKRIVNVTGS